MKLLPLVENKLFDAIQKYGNTVNSGILHQLYSGDPSETKKYFNWMIVQRLQDQNISPSVIVNVVDSFHQNIHKITNESVAGLDVSDRIKRTPKDINVYNLSELIDVVQAIKQYKSKRETKQEGIDIIYEDDRWLVLRPLTQEASCYYGSGTKWCTAAKYDNRFFSYTREALLIYFIDKSRQEGRYYRMALHMRILNDESIIHWYDESDDRFHPEITLLLPSELLTQLDQYIESFQKQHLTKLTKSEIREKTINLLLAKKSIKTTYGEWTPYYDRVNGILFWDAGPQIFKTFPNIYNWDISGAPFYGNQTTFSFNSRVDLKNTELDNPYVFDQYFKFDVEHIIPVRENEEAIQEFFDYIVDEYHRLFRTFVHNAVEYYGLTPSIHVWSPANGRSTYAFHYPPKRNSITSLFVKYVVRRQRRNLPATKRDFYKTVLGYNVNVGNLSPQDFNDLKNTKLHPHFIYDYNYDQKTIKKLYGSTVYNPSTNKIINLNGHNTQFFAAIVDSGILSREGQFYTIGPNYEDWINGALQKKIH